jgi:hypothetical protein
VVGGSYGLGIGAGIGAIAAKILVAFAVGDLGFRGSHSTFGQ